VQSPRLPSYAESLQHANSFDVSHDGEALCFNSGTSAPNYHHTTSDEPQYQSTSYHGYYNTFPQQPDYSPCNSWSEASSPTACYYGGCSPMPGCSPRKTSSSGSNMPSVHNGYVRGNFPYSDSNSQQAICGYSNHEPPVAPQVPYYPPPPTDYHIGNGSRYNSHPGSGLADQTEQTMATPFVSSAQVNPLYTCSQEAYANATAMPVTYCKTSADRVNLDRDMMY